MTPRGALPLGAAIFVGYLSIAIAFGALGRNVGLTLAATASFSLFVFAGASQFLALELLAGGAGALSIVVATFVINLRHIVMSRAIRDRIHGDRIPSPILAFGITDEVFTAATTRAASIRDGDLFLMEVLAYSGWVLGTIAGFIAGRFLPGSVDSAMGIAMYAMFVALIVPGIMAFWRYGVVAAAAGGLNALLTVMGAPRGIALVIAIVGAAVAFSFSEVWSEEGD